jgi:hypothetical protein
MVYFANFQHIYFLSELTFCTTILVHHVLLYVVVSQESSVRDGWDLFKWAPMSCLCLITFCYTWWYRMEVMWGMDRTYSKGNPLSRLCLAMFCHTWMFHILYMRGKDPLHSKRSVSEVGRCPCSDLTHGCRFYSERYCMWTLPWRAGTEGSFSAGT